MTKKPKHKGVAVVISIGSKPKDKKDHPSPVPMAKAWETLKAFPEHQQYQPLPGLGEGFEQMTPQRRIGTVPPAIRSMLQRLQHPEKRFDSWSGEYRDNPAHNKVPPTLRTYLAGEAPRGTLEEMPQRRAQPEFETYGDDTGMSPQFVNAYAEPYVEGFSNIDPDDPTGGLVAGSHRTNQTLKPPKGSPQHLIDELHEINPEGMKRVVEG